ncbi:hypothetical protein D3C81_643950 [compost metagenome]
MDRSAGHVSGIECANAEVEVHTHAHRQVHADGFRLVPLGQADHIALGLLVELLHAGLVLEPDAVVVVRPATRRLAFEAALGSAGRQVPGRLRRIVIEAAGDQWPIRVAVHEVDDYLMANARDIDAAELGASPGLHHTHPAGVRLIVTGVAVPQEAHLDAAEFVRPDRGARRTDHNRRLRTVRIGLGRRAGHAEDLVGRLHLELVPTLVLIAGARFVGNLCQRQPRFHHEVLAVRAAVRVAGEHEGLAASHAAYIAMAERARPFRARFFHADTTDHVAMSCVGKVTWPLEHVPVGPCGATRLLISLQQPCPRAREVVVDHFHAAGTQCLVHRERRDVFDIDLVVVGVIFDLVVSLAAHAAVCPDVIAQHKPVLAVRMLEEPVDAPFLHQALDEVEVRLAILDLELARIIALGFARQRILSHVEPLLHRVGIVGQDVVDDLEYGFVLVDLEVVGQRGQPQPRPQHHAIDVIASLLVQVTGRDNEPTDLPRASPYLGAWPLAAPINLDRERHLLANQRFQVEVRARRQRQLVVVRRA